MKGPSTHWYVRTFDMAGMFVKDRYVPCLIIGWNRDGNPIVKMPDGSERMIEKSNREAGYAA